MRGRVRGSWELIGLVSTVYSVELGRDLVRCGAGDLLQGVN